MRGSTWDAIEDAQWRAHRIRKGQQAKARIGAYLDTGWDGIHRRRRLLLRDINRIVHRNKVKATRRQHKGGHKDLTYYNRRG
jgi:hypothetical protein